jgi:hypothetical protein
MTAPVKVRKKLIEVALPLELRHRRLKRQIGSPLFRSFAIGNPGLVYPLWRAKKSEFRRDLISAAVWEAALASEVSKASA